MIRQRHAFGALVLAVATIAGALAAGAESDAESDAASGAETAGQPLVVGSKSFTESVILGEIASQLLEDARFDVRHRRELGGTRVLWNALVRGDIDAYPDYTGTLRAEILAGRSIEGLDALRAALDAQGVRISAPLGFNNTYVLGLREERAQALGVGTISDLREHPGLRFGFSNEFMQRADGWPGLKAHYGLPQTDVSGLEHALAYQGLGAGELDVIDLYSTDAEIAYYDLATLDDDADFFPDYEAVFVYRQDLPARAEAALGVVAGSIDEARMVRMNARAKLEREPEAEIAADFVARQWGVEAEIAVADRWQRFTRHTAEHITLVAISLSAAVAIAIPLGIVAFRRPRLGQVLLSLAGVLQTLPALALLVFLIPWLGIGQKSAIMALFLYSLLPVLRNTHAGLADIAQDLRESAAALGLPARARLRHIELPLAARSILAGIKTAAVINVGTATLGALIGAGGYGQPILTGIRLDDMGLILEGAVPAAGLALLAQGLFELIERRWVVAK